MAPYRIPASDKGPPVLLTLSARLRFLLLMDPVLEAGVREGCPLYCPCMYLQRVRIVIITILLII